MKYTTFNIILVYQIHHLLFSIVYLNVPIFGNKPIKSEMLVILVYYGMLSTCFRSVIFNNNNVLTDST